MTNATNNQRGTAYVSDLGLSSGMIRASFSLNQSYGSGSTDQADGLSVYYGQFNNETTALFDGDLPVAGLRVRYHIENNAFSPVDESITVHYNGAQIFNQQVNLTTTPIDFKETDFSVSPAGLFNLAYDGNTIFQGMIAGWNPQPDWQFALTARTGGRNSQQFVDNLLLATPEPSRVALLGLGGVLFAARRRR
ncbi:MAG: PEP-CTERM sorting domain-containing protein [Verrucomicrobiales bacterium]